VIRFARPGHASPWLLNLLARKPKKLAAIALANNVMRPSFGGVMRSYSS
jgi:hypothetical protein